MRLGWVPAVAHVERRASALAHARHGDVRDGLAHNLGPRHTHGRKHLQHPALPASRLSLHPRRMPEPRTLARQTVSTERRCARSADLGAALALSSLRVLANASVPEPLSLRCLGDRRVTVFRAFEVTPGDDEARVPPRRPTTIWGMDHREAGSATGQGP
jgi:hypothetical protein